MSGFPARPPLADFGTLVLLDARPVVDPTKEFSAAQWNLIKHQASGMGLLAPLVMAKVTVTGAGVLLAHAEAYNPKGLTSAPFLAPTPAAVATGRITLSYPTPIPDQLGVDQTIAFNWGFGFAHADPPTTFRHVMVTPIAATPHILSISVFDAAGALQDGSNVWVFAG